MNSTMTRRRLLQMLGASALISAQSHTVTSAIATGRIAIVGGGFGGATCARYLKQLAPTLDVTLFEPAKSFVTCPFSNSVIAGLNSLEAITHRYDALEQHGIKVHHAVVSAVDPEARTIRLSNGARMTFDRIVLSPGIDIKWDSIAGYNEAAAQLMPHAWKAGPQTLLLRQQLEAMRDGGVVIMTIPANPYRCPPGPYERASLIAHYLKSHKPRSKLLLLDAKDTFSKQALFLEGWKNLYGSLIEWVPFSAAGNIIRIEPASKTIYSEFATHRADVANIIPPQRAAAITQSSGLSGGADWCVVNSSTFESIQFPGIHLIGDAILAGDMPKSAFAAGSQAKVCAHAIAALQSGTQPGQPILINTCYSLVAPDYGISVADIYRIGTKGTISAVQGAGGTSPIRASPEVRRNEANYARSWYLNTITEIFG